MANKLKRPATITMTLGPKTWVALEAYRDGLSTEMTMTTAATAAMMRGLRWWAKTVPGFPEVPPSSKD